MSAWEITNDFLFPDNSHYIDELDCGENWSLVTTNGENNFLIAKSQLVEFWTKKTKLLPYDLFVQQQIGDTELFLLASRKPFVIGEVGSFYQYNPIDALAFACAMKVWNFCCNSRWKTWPPTLQSISSLLRFAKRVASR